MSAGGLEPDPPDPGAAAKPIDVAAVRARVAGHPWEGQAYIPGLCDEIERLRRESLIFERQREIARSPTALEQRLLAAWRSSGKALGELLVLATNAYALGAAVSMPGLVDEAIVSMCERYVAEHAEPATVPGR